MTRTLTVAGIQTSYGEDMQANIDKTIAFVREAAGQGAQVILPSELFQGPYFCVSQEEHWFTQAYEWREHPCVVAMAPVARELGVAIPVSIFEKDGPQYYNSLVMLDADGEALGVYRKSHPRRPRLSGEVLFPAGRYGFQGLEDSLRQGRGRHLLGPVVPGSGAGHDADGRRRADVSDRHRHRAARRDPAHGPAVAARHAGPCGVQRRAGRRRQSHRP